jgi:3-oxoacyl-[acyl-carrier-protein] synthase-3
VPIRIAGTGTHLPGPPIDVASLKAFLRKYPDGLSERMQDRLVVATGIDTRHLAIDLTDESQRETNTSMAAEAGRHALRRAGWTAEDVELLVVTTIVPDHLMPPTSTLVQEALGISRCAEIEISANCSAPYKALAFAASELELGHYRRALICSSQYCSVLFRPPWANPERMTADQGALRWIVSDGAAAVALERSDSGSILRVWLESAGVGKRSGMFLPFGAASPGFQESFSTGSQHIVQESRYVLREGFALAVAAFERLISELGIDAREIDHFIPSISTMEVARKLLPVLRDQYGLRPDAWRMNLPRIGYVGGVTFFAVLDDLVREGRLKSGELVCSVAEESSKWMCAGAVFRWSP